MARGAFGPEQALVVAEMMAPPLGSRLRRSIEAATSMTHPVGRRPAPTGSLDDTPLRKLRTSDRSG